MRLKKFVYAIVLSTTQRCATGMNPWPVETHGRVHRASNLALLMGMQKHLHLVVRNGCANKPQVKALLDAGVKVVIATSTAINDASATIFSGQFYNALRAGKTIAEAFDTAMSYLEEKYLSDATHVQMRDIVMESNAQPLPPWGLYCIEPNDLNWKLPEETFPDEAIQDFWKYQEEID